MNPWQSEFCNNVDPTQGALLLEQNDEWAVQRARYMTLKTMAPLSDDPPISLSVVARRSSRHTPKMAVTVMASYTTRWDTIAAQADRRWG